MPTGWLVAIIFVAGIVVLIFLVIFIKFLGAWIRSVTSGVGDEIGLFSLIAMSLRRVSPEVILNSMIQARKAGLPGIRRERLEAQYMAGGKIERTASGPVLRVIAALIAANKARIEISFDQTCAIDLTGRHILDAINTSVNPRVIDCPPQTGGRATIDAVAIDGIQLKARARVTVRTCLERLVGGATEETVIARVGEGIVSAIGSSASHKAVLENPDRISKAVLSRGLDAGTAFEIVSIDIADIDVGQNIGARLQADQAEADMRVARAKAEERAAMARAREQEMQAKVVENQALVVLAQAEVPKAIAGAFREGKLGVMDYMQYRNIQADTDMRRSISGEEKTSGKE